MYTDPTVAVVVPVYNGARTLPRCLQALRLALPDDGEIIVVDDGSTDNSGALARAAGVRVVRHGQTRGTSAARNSGWRASRAPRIAFVDSDVELAPGALQVMLAALDADPELLGVNGIYALDGLPPGLVTAFTNNSIVYQHTRHGPRVASAFTGLCMMKRATLETMGGWDERWSSRYADDVFTRYVLPPCCIALEPDARGVHLKRISMGGLLRHRFNIAWHYLRSIQSYWTAVRERPTRSVLDLRYPANTALAVAWLGGLAFPPLLVLPAVASTVVNAPFARFTLHNRGPFEAVVAVPLSVLEGGAFLAGLTLSALDELRSGVDAEQSSVMPPCGPLPPEPESSRCPSPTALR